jgi:hypothetical protein
MLKLLPSAGFDFVNMFDTKQYSTGLFLLRCDDLPGEVITQKRFCIPFMVIPGPNQPKSLDIYVELIADDFVSLQPRPHGSLDHQEYGLLVRDKDGQAEVRHYAVANGLHADTPARGKFGNFMGGSAAYLACNWCWGTGAREEPFKNRTLFFGYSKAREASRGWMLGSAFRLGHDDEARAVTEDDHRLRAAVAAGDEEWDPEGYLQARDRMSADGVKVDDREDLAKHLGAWGWSIMHNRLSYLHYANFFLVPLYHTLFLGVVKDFWQLCLNWVSTRLHSNCLRDP